MDEKQVIDVLLKNIEPLLNILVWVSSAIMVIFIASLTWAWKISTFLNSMSNDISSLNDAVKLLGGSIGKLIGRVDIIDKKLTHIDSHLVKLDVHFPDAPNYQAFSIYTQASSPLTLTTEGEKMVDESGFYKVLEDNQGVFDGIIANAEARLDQEAFIEKAAFEKVESMFDEDNVIVAPVAQFMYEQGMRQSKQVYNGAIRAFGVATRDAIFLHMGINPPIAKQHLND